jgi:hypothetical protein
VATSSHSEYEAALVKMQQNLGLFGLDQPEVIFTDNPTADGQFLERIYPTLTKDIVPVEKYPKMKLFSIPEIFDVRAYSSAAVIEEARARITQDLNLKHLSLLLALMLGGTVDHTKGGGAQPTAIIQAAYQTWLNIFWIRHFNGNFPATLISFLANPQILKVGHNVTGDLNHLARECGAGPFSGGIELARLAKDLRAIKDARIGLVCTDSGPHAGKAS